MAPTRHHGGRILPHQRDTDDLAPLLGADLDLLMCNWAGAWGHLALLREGGTTQFFLILHQLLLQLFLQAGVLGHCLCLFLLRLCLVLLCFLGLFALRSDGL